MQRIARKRFRILDMLFGHHVGNSSTLLHRLGVVAKDQSTTFFGSNVECMPTDLMQQFAGDRVSSELGVQFDSVGHGRGFPSDPMVGDDHWCHRTLGNRHIESTNRTAGSLIEGI